MDSPTTLQFGPYNIRLDEKLLRRGSEPVALPPKAVETLILLVRAGGQVVSKEEIMRTVWPDAVVEENNLTQQISILRKTLGNGSGATFIQTVPKRGYRFVAPEAESHEPEPRALSGRPRNIAAAIAILAVIAAVIAMMWPKPIRSIAVLPVQPLTANDELNAVGLGISDAVVQRLTYARDLDVLPMSSVRKYLGRNVDPLAVGRELNVDAVLTGTIQRAGDRFRVTMELVDIRRNRTLWSGKIEEKASDLFRLQDIVAEATLRSLPSKAKKTASASVQTPVPAAHEAFLKGRYYWSRRIDGDVSLSIAEFEKAVAADPNFAPAWAGLASALNLRSLHFLSEPAKSFVPSRAAARRALELDPNLAEAHAAMGFISFYYDWNWSEAEKAFRRAIELDPHTGNYRQLLSNLLVATGRFDEAIKVIHEAIDADPAALMVRSVAARQYYLARRYDKALEIWEKTRAMDSSFRASRTGIANALTAMGRYDEAEREFRLAIDLGSTQSIMHLAYLSALRGDETLARKQIAEGHRAASGGAMLHYDAAPVYAVLGDFDAAFHELDAATRKRYSGMVWLYVDPRMDPLRSDPRFAEALKRVGFPRNR